jgi:hypothetical protein
VSELEEYLTYLFIDKLDSSIEHGELSFTPEEISNVIELAIEFSLTGAHRVHSVN